MTMIMTMTIIVFLALFWLLFFGGGASGLLFLWVFVNGLRVIAWFVRGAVLGTPVFETA